MRAGSRWCSTGVKNSGPLLSRPLTVRLLYDSSMQGPAGTRQGGSVQAKVAPIKRGKGKQVVNLARDKQAPAAKEVTVQPTAAPTRVHHGRAGGDRGRQPVRVRELALHPTLCVCVCVCVCGGWRDYFISGCQALLPSYSVCDCWVCSIRLCARLSTASAA